MLGRLAAVRVVALALMAMACSGDGDSPLEPQNLAGNWTGTTSQGRAISFVVTAQGIADGSFSYHLNGQFCSYDASVQVGSSEATPIANGAFNTGQVYIGQFAYLVASGRFTSSTQASGSLAITDSDCGGSVNLTWSATKQR